MRTKIKLSDNQQQKDKMYIWVTYEEYYDTNIQNQIKEWKKTYRTTVFRCGKRDPNIFFQQFLDFATL